MKKEVYLNDLAKYLHLELPLESSESVFISITIDKLIHIKQAMDEGGEVSKKFEEELKRRAQEEAARIAAKVTKEILKEVMPEVVKMEKKLIKIIFKRIHSRLKKVRKE